MASLESAGVIVIRFENDVPYFLLLRSFDFWDFPKGNIEDGENKIQAAIREVKEESGIEDLNFKWGKSYYQTESFGKGKKVVYYFIAETKTKDIVIDVNPKTGLKEHDSFKWVSYEEAMNLLTDRICRAIIWAVDRLKVFENKKEV